MSGPQVVLLALLVFEAGCSIAKHGTLRTGKFSAWENFLFMAIIVAILYWGGFWEGAIK